MCWPPQKPVEGTLPARRGCTYLLGWCRRFHILPTLETYPPQHCPSTGFVGLVTAIGYNGECSGWKAGVCNALGPIAWSVVPRTRRQAVSGTA